MGAADELIDEVCDIVGHHHHPGENETVNYRVLYDADLISNLEENQMEKPSDSDPERIKEIIKTSFLTDSGKKIAESVLLKN